MAQQTTIKARELVKILESRGWTHAHTVGSHRKMVKPGHRPFPVVYGDNETLGRAILSKIQRDTGETLFA